MVCSESRWALWVLITALKETTEQKRVLSKEEPQVFSYFVEYLYHEAIWTCYITPNAFQFYW